MQAKTKTLIITLSVLGVAVAVGIPTGLILGENLKAPTVSYGDFSGDAYSYDMTAGRIKYQACDGDYSDLTAVDAFNISLDLLSDIENYRLQGYGQATALIVTQDIRSTIIRDGDSYFEESFSKSSMVQCAWRMYQSEDDVRQYRGELTSLETATFDETEGETYSFPSYAERMGRLISDRSIYIVSDKTVLPDGISSFEKDGDGYRLHIDLHPGLAVLNYVKQMQTVSDLPSPPSFNSFSLEMEMDESLRPVSLTTFESYYATTSMGIGSNVNGEMTTYFELDGGFEIPSLNEPESYDHV